MFHSEWAKEGVCEFCGKEGLVDVDWVREGDDEMRLVFICDSCRALRNEELDNAK